MPPEQRSTGDTRVNELHRAAPRVKHTRKTFVAGLDDVWGIDLVDMSAYQSENDGFKWMMTAIDIHSRYAWAVPIRNKTADSTLIALRLILDDSGRRPSKAWWDSGGEFLNAKMKAYLKHEQIESYSTYGQHKSVFVERFNRTLKSRMFKVFSAQHSYNWLNILPGLMEGYNTSKHRSIKMTPEQASDPKNEQRLLDLQNKDASEHLSPPKGKSPFAIGDFVRVSRKKGTFEKGYTARWSEEIFRVTSILHTNPRVYQLEDLNHEPVLGAFYGIELQRTAQKPTDKFLIQHILEKKGDKSKVVWYGFNDKAFDSWIPTNSITMFKHKGPRTKTNPQPVGEAVMFPHWRPGQNLKTITYP